MQHIHLMDLICSCSNDGADIINVLRFLLAAASLSLDYQFNVFIFV